MLVRLEVHALFGTMNVSIMDTLVPVPPGEILVIPVDFRAAMSLDPSQADHLTPINARVTVLGEQMQPRNSYRLDQRFLAMGDSDASRLVTSETRRREFPYGISNVTLLRQVRHIEAIAPEDGMNLGYGPGVAIESPVGRAQRPTDF